MSLNKKLKIEKSLLNTLYLAEIICQHRLAWGMASSCFR